MILVVGATGTNGREVVQRLAARGVPVRAQVRDPDMARDLEGPGVALVAADLDAPVTLDAAMAGVDRVFFVSAVDRQFPRRFKNFLTAARRAGTPRVVKLSALGAGSDSASELIRQHTETDARLAASGLPFTVLRPNSFHQNLLRSAGTIKDHGAFYRPVRDARQSLVDVRDIADVAVAALTGSGHEGRIYEITGPEALSCHDVAAMLTAVLGKPVRYVDVPPRPRSIPCSRPALPSGARGPRSNCTGSSPRERPPVSPTPSSG
jgi:uncharacterized protein YbjT (DUF2867 family)